MTELAEAPALPRADVATLADNFIDLVRAFNRARARWLAAAADDVEWSAQVVLRCVNAEGPMRASALAECLQSDPSTVSRQVAALVKDGLLERRADPDDGRASLLVLTAKADVILADHDEVRVNHFVDMLAGWTPDEVTQFTSLLRRFTDAYEQSTSARIEAKTARAGRND